MEELSVHIVVVDNDGVGDAFRVIEQCSPDLRRRICFDTEPRVGIAHARNRTVQLADAVDWIAFVDDDEIPPPDWISSLLMTQQRYGADVVTGAVTTRLPHTAKPWCEAVCHFRDEHPPTGTRMATATTASTLVRRDLLGDAPFDSRHFNMHGEDTDCFVRLAQAGAVIVADATHPVVTEVHSERQTLRWILRRSWVGGADWARVVRRYDRRLVVTLRLVLLGVGHGIAGTGRTLGGALVLDRGRAADGLCEVARGVAQLAGACTRRLPIPDGQLA